MSVCIEKMAVCGGWEQHWYLNEGIKHFLQCLEYQVWILSTAAFYINKRKQEMSSIGNTIQALLGLIQEVCSRNNHYYQHIKMVYEAVHVSMIITATSIQVYFPVLMCNIGIKIHDTGAHYPHILLRSWQAKVGIVSEYVHMFTHHLHLSKKPFKLL